MVTNQRIEWVDIAKGLGIILVIAGHTIALDYSYPIYSFHMPLFFLLSGLFVKNRDNWKKYIIGSAHKTLWPWLWMLTISMIVCLLIPQWRDVISFQSVVTDLYSSNTNVFQNSSLWFLICLFWVEVFFFLLDKVKSLFSNHSIIFYCLIIAYSIGLLWLNKALYVINQYVPLLYGRLPFKTDTALICLLFFAIGYWFKKDVIAVVSKSKWHIVIIVIILWGIIAWWDRGINYNALQFGKFKVFFYPLAFLGILMILWISELISQLPMLWLRKILSFYGRNSLIIFGFQSLFIRLYLLITNYIFDLNMRLYANNPWQHQILSFILVAFVVSPIIAYWYEHIILKYGEK